MTPLRQRMLEDLQLRGMSERTQECYIRAVRQLAQHYHKSPNLVTEEELRQYFLWMKNVKHYSRAATTIALCGIKFFFRQTLKQDWTTLKLVRTPPRRLEPAGSARHPASGPAAALPRLFNHDLFLRPASRRGHWLASPRRRLAPPAASHPPRQGWPRPLCPLAPTHSRAVARVLENPPQPRLALSRLRSGRHPQACGHPPLSQNQLADRLPPGRAGQRHSQARFHPHAAPFLRSRNTSGTVPPTPPSSTPTSPTKSSSTPARPSIT